MDHLDNCCVSSSIPFLSIASSRSLTKVQVKAADRSVRPTHSQASAAVSWRTAGTGCRRRSLDLRVLARLLFGFGPAGCLPELPDVFRTDWKRSRHKRTVDSRCRARLRNLARSTRSEPSQPARLRSRTCLFSASRPDSRSRSELAKCESWDRGRPRRRKCVREMNQDKRRSGS